jgi:bifunctional DNase/RNase
VEVEKLLFDPDAGVSALVLKEKKGERQLPVWIGHTEALAIAAAIEGMKFSRPMTHDLLRSVIEHLDTKIEWVRVHDVVDGTFLGLIGLDGPQGKREVDSRPSDAIALALRVGAPVFVDSALLEPADARAGTPLPIAGDSAADEDLLANLPDEIFGKYKM